MFLGFETWRDFDVDLYETIEEALIKRIREVPVKNYRHG